MGGRRSRVLLANTSLHRLQAQLEFQDPLFLVVRTKFAGMVGKLGCAVALKLPRKVRDLRLKLLI